MLITVSSTILENPENQGPGDAGLPLQGENKETRPKHFCKLQLTSILMPRSPPRSPRNVGKLLRVNLLKAKLVVSKTSPIPGQALHSMGIARCSTPTNWSSWSPAGDSVPHKPEAWEREKHCSLAISAKKCHQLETSPWQREVYRHLGIIYLLTGFPPRVRHCGPYSKTYKCE